LQPIERQHFDCVCGTDEHTFKFTFDPDDGDLYLSAYLSQYRNVFQRIGEAVKYVFGYTSKYGHWDTTIVSRDDTARLAALCQRSIEVRDAYVASHEQALSESLDALRDDVIDVHNVDLSNLSTRIVIPAIQE
jgi:hypothetical protein